MKKLIWVLVSILVMAQTLWAQEYYKHPRVVEVEEKLTQDAYQFLEKRFPKVPFIVNIEIDPLRRAGGIQYDGTGETLPYLDMDQEEIKDEWDDVTLTIYQLIPRIKKATITITVSESLEVSEVDEIKASLLSHLKLIPARDEIKVVQKAWKQSTFGIYEYLIIALAILLIVILGVSVKLSIRSLGKSLQVSHGNQMMTSASASSSVTSSGQTATAGKMGIDKMPHLGGDFRLQDPIRTRQIIQAKIKELTADPKFPTLEDMIKLEKYAKQKTSTIGALLYEFSRDYQQKIFSLGRDKIWFEIFANPGELSETAIELLDSMLRMRNNENDPEWEALLIQLWRMEEQVPEVLKKLDQTEGFSILKDLPKSISIPAARTLYPGAWGTLLDVKMKKEKVVTKKRIQEVYDLCCDLMPAFRFSSLSEYVREKDLLDYLKTADVLEERDIYRTISEESFLYDVRPPFFVLFESDKIIIEKIAPMFSLDQWAVVLFNTPRDFRKVIGNCFNDKMNFMLSGHLKDLDKNPPDKQEQGELREHVAKKTHALLKELAHQNASLNSKEKNEITSNEVA